MPGKSSRVNPKKNRHKHKHRQNKQKGQDDASGRKRLAPPSIAQALGGGADVAALMSQLGLGGGAAPSRQRLENLVRDLQRQVLPVPAPAPSPAAAAPAAAAGASSRPVLRKFVPPSALHSQGEGPAPQGAAGVAAGVPAE